MIQGSNQTKSHSSELNLERVAGRSPSYSPLANETNSAKMRPSKRLFVPSATSIPLICDETGIVASINVPSLGSSFLLYTSPFALLENARMFAQNSFPSLMEVDAQILSGILLTLAADYSLFRFSPSYSGAQKNSLLRTVEKRHLITSIHIIEQKINSGNFSYLPKLSFLMDGGVTLAGEFNRRLAEWNTTVANILLSKHTLRNDSSLEDQFYSEKPVRTMEAQTTKKQKRFNESAKIAQTKAFRLDKATAQVIIKSLSKQTLISTTRASKLKELFSGENFLLAKPEFLTLIKMALSGTDNVEVNKLIELIDKKYPMLQASAEVDDELWGEAKTEEPSPKGTDSQKDNLPANNDSTEQVKQILLITDSVEEKKEEIVIDFYGKAFILTAGDWNSLNFMEKISYKKNLRAQYTDEQWAEIADYVKGMTPADFEDSVDEDSNELDEADSSEQSDEPVDGEDNV